MGVENENSAYGTFWEHLEEFRGCLLRIIAVTCAISIILFCIKDLLFDIILAPTSSDFITFKLIGAEKFRIKLINTGLTEQFSTHIKTALSCGLLLSSPYILFEIFRYISPALYSNERKLATRLTFTTYLMFSIGILINYFILFPLTVKFLGTYQVSDDINNMLTISSYIDTLINMSLVIGIIFELPVVCWMLASFGILKAEWMKKFRRHSIVAILVLSAIITPTTDMFTLIVVSLPIWLLYELSVVIVSKTNKSRQNV